MSRFNCKQPFGRPSNHINVVTKQAATQAVECNKNKVCVLFDGENRRFYYTIYYYVCLFYFILLTLPKSFKDHAYVEAQAMCQPKGELPTLVLVWTRYNLN